MRVASLYVLLGSLAATVAASEMAWVSDYETARARATASGRLVMIDFYTDWCVWCKRLDQGTFTDEKVIRLAQGVLPVKVNAEKEGRSLAREYAVRGFPTILFVDGQGSLKKTIGGYLPPAGFAFMPLRPPDRSSHAQT